MIHHHHHPPAHHARPHHRHKARKADNCFLFEGQCYELILEEGVPETPAQIAEDEAQGAEAYGGSPEGPGT